MSHHAHEALLTAVNLVAEAYADADICIPSEKYQQALLRIMAAIISAIAASVISDPIIWRHFATALEQALCQ